MLADDSTIHTSGQNVLAITYVLQPCLSGVVEWTYLNHIMSLSPLKTKYVILTARQKRLLHSPSAHLSVGNQQITEVSDHKVLGVTTDSNLPLGPHFRDVYNTTAKMSTNQQKISIFLTFMPQFFFFQAHI